MCFVVLETEITDMGVIENWWVEDDEEAAIEHAKEFHAGLTSRAVEVYEMKDDPIFTAGIY